MVTHQMGFAPKICTVGRVMDFPGDAKALGGALALGITLELGWIENECVREPSLRF